MTTRAHAYAVVDRDNEFIWAGESYEEALAECERFSAEDPLCRMLFCLRKGGSSNISEWRPLARPVVLLPSPSVSGSDLRRQQDELDELVLRRMGASIGAKWSLLERIPQRDLPVDEDEERAANRREVERARRRAAIGIAGWVAALFAVIIVSYILSK